ncbi:hypothetical protein MPC38_10945 [Prescottella equi]|uniref:hypothetical protein n=1 Tax=Rhodococcus hoagii TaxID=43767 RepID=UPI0019DDB627|nr:hypothetical protein [Prescottella equi]NKT12473.1 hypothetical protein [Prescottella equi]NKW49511.1 hypothetical protein [Prescottella equi]UNQ41708.1 hypothetical protein MPC38_10945 [Prescottella equi]
MSRPGPAAKAQLDERLRQQRCLDLRVQGKTLQEIADAEGYADRSGPHRAIQSLLGRVETEKVSELRELESARLDALQGAHWPAAVSGDVKSADFVLRVSARRSKLLGLDVPDRVIVAEAAAPSDEDFAATMIELLTDLAEARSRDAMPDTDADADDWCNIGTETERTGQ